MVIFIKKIHISNLKTEIKLLHKSTRYVLKARINDTKAFKSVFKDILYDITEKKIMQV